MLPLNRVTTHSSSPLSHFHASPIAACVAGTISNVSMFMKCQVRSLPMPSMKDNCMSVSVTSASSNESLDFSVCSVVRPSFRLRMRMRVNAWPLPGLMKSASVMIQGSPLWRIFLPVLTSLRPRVAMRCLLQR